MLIAVLCLLAGCVPIVLYFAKQTKANTPSLQWPVLAKELGWQYQGQPAPKMLGDFEGRHASVELREGRAVVALQLVQKSRLRVQVGAKAEIEARAGMVIPDRIQTGDAAFEGRLMARCSEREAGQMIFEPALRQRLLDQPVVDVLAAGDRVQWTLPALKESDVLEQVLGVMTAVAAEMERFPANANA